MNQPMVTVVIPIYNVEKYLDRCIEAVISQTYENLQIVLVDDGSTDGCPEKCDEWSKKDTRIKVVHKKNAGLGMARNTGIDEAAGKYIFFFDSDDYVDCTVVEKCVASAESNESDVVIFRYATAFEDGTIEDVKLKLVKTVFECDEIRDKLLPGMFTYDMGFGISSCGKMYRLSSINDKQLRFKSEREIISEDAYFALEFYSKIKKASIVNESLYFYCKRGNSLSRSYKSERQERNDDFIKKSIAYIDKEGLSDCVKNHIIARYHMYTIAAIKQLKMSSLSPTDKKYELNRILKGETLHGTLDFKVLKLHKLTVAALLFCIKLKLYPICKALISCKKMKGV